MSAFRFTLVFKGDQFVCLLPPGKVEKPVAGLTYIPMIEEKVFTLLKEELQNVLRRNRDLEQEIESLREKDESEDVGLG